MEQLKICYEYWDGGLYPCDNGPRPRVTGVSLKKWFNVFVGGMDRAFCNNSFRRKIDNDSYYYEYAIYFEERKFIVIYEGMKYYLDLDEEIIDNYEKGEYNAITLELKKLLDKFNWIIKKDKIIDEAKKGIFKDDESKKIYIGYLQNIYNQEINKWSLDNTNRFFLFFAIQAIIFTVAFIMDTALIPMLLGIKVLAVTDFIASTIAGICFIKCRKKYKQKLKIYSDKINKLNLELNGNTKELPYRQTEVISVSKEEKPVSAILQELSNAVLKIKYLNDEDKKVCGDMAMAILDEYTKRAKEINLANSSEEIVLELDGELVLKSNMVKQIRILEDEINKRMDVTKKNQGIDNDYEIVAKQIEECCSIDDKVIGGGHLIRART